MALQFSASHKIIEMDDKYAASIALCAIGLYAAIKTYQNESYIAFALATVCTVARFLALSNVVITDLKNFMPRGKTWQVALRFLVTFLVVEFGLIFAFGMAFTSFPK